MDIKDGTHYATIPYDEFDTFLRKPLLAKIKINFIPLISEITQNRWIESFGSEKVVNKIVSNIYDKVATDGSFEIIKTIETPIVPKPGIAETFEIVFDKDEFGVIKDIPFKIAFINTGIDRVQDLIVDIVDGKSLIKNIDLNTTKSFLSGIARNSGLVRLRGVRKIDDKISTASINPKVFEPQWESKTNTYEVYIGEDFEFDARIKEISQNKISTTIKSALINTGEISFKSPFVELPAFSSAGSLELQVYVDGNEVKDLRSVLTVKTPPPPEIDLRRIGDSNNVEFLVTVFGKTNEVTLVRPRSGIAALTENPEKEKLNNKTIYIYRATISEPREFGSTEKEINLQVRDKFGVTTTYQRVVEYLLN